MTASYIPPGMLTFATVLARLAEAWMPEAWADSPPAERGVLLGEPLDNFRYKAALRSGALPDAIYARLRTTLVDGRLPAVLHVKVGPPRPIPHASWQSDGASDLGAVLAGHVDFTLAGGAVERGAVLVPEDTLAALLEGRPVPVSGAAPVEPVQPPTAVINGNMTKPTHSGGGMRSNPDADLFWIEVCRHVAKGNIRGGVTGFAEVMEGWAEANMRKPWEMETIRKKLGLMFRTIGWDDV